MAFVYEGAPGRWVTPSMLEDTEEVGWGRNLLRNGDLESWSAGASSAPDRWTLSGAGATVARDVDKRMGDYAAKTTYGSAELSFYQDVPVGEWEHLKGRTVTFSAWIKTSTSNIARLRINDGAGISESAFHDGDGTYQILTVTRTLDESATQLRGALKIVGAGNALMDGAILVEGDMEQAFATHYEDHHLPEEGVAPSVRAYHSGHQDAPDNTDYAVVLGSEWWDTDEIHDNVTNNTRLTCKTKGKYQISGTLEWAINAVGIRVISIRLNGSTYLARESREVAAAGFRRMAISTLWDLNVDDYVELVAYQNSGGDLRIRRVANYSPEFGMVRVGP